MVKSGGRGLRVVGLGLVVVCAASCGGGGGGGSEGGGGGSGSATGFVPAAPTPGATLYADAAVLRPLRDGALWVYRGVRVSSTPVTNYTSYARQAAAASGLTETAFTELDGAGYSERNVELVGGTVRVRESVAGLPGSEASYAELRSPVRANEQTTLIDQRNVALGADIEGDGRNDSADIGAYSRVIGNEDVSLPELGRTLNALRVDTTATVRLRLTSRGSAEAPVSVIVSTWYAPGIGVVRTSSTVQSSTGASTPDTDERLQFWDGVDTGVGLWPSVRTPRVGGSPSFGPWLYFPYSATRVGERVFVLTGIASSGDPDQGLVASVLDARGNVVANVDHVGLGLDPNFRPQLMPLGTGAAFAITEPGTPNGGPYLPENLRLVVLDGNAQRTLSPVLVSGGLPRTLRAASDGQTVWVAWAEAAGPFASYRVMVQRFGADGAPLSAPEQLDTSSSQPDRVEVSAAPGRALVVWHLPEFGERYQQALVPAAGAASIGTLAAGVFSSSGEAARPTPWLSPSLAAVTWYRPLDQVNVPNSQQPPLRGVTLDAAAAPRRSTTGSIDSELLAVPAHDSGSAGLAVDGGSLRWASGGSAVLSANEVVAQRYIEWRSFTPGDGALATAAPTVQRFRDSTPLNAATYPPLQVQRIVALNDRWLILGYDGVRLTVAVLHR